MSGIIDWEWSHENGFRIVDALQLVFMSYSVFRNTGIAALILWFDYLRERITRGRMPTVEWTEDMIRRTIPTISRWLKESRGGTSEAAVGQGTERLAVPGV